MKLALISLLTCLVVVSGCGGGKPQPQVEPQPEAPAASAAPAISLPERPPYLLGVGDKLEVRFPYYPGYNLFLVVRPDGMITVPHMGDVMVEGMTPMELQSLIMAKYAEVVTQPEVAVIVAEPASAMVFVLGEVRLPTAYPLKGQMTVLEAIAGAGGVTYLGKGDSVILIRQADGGRVKGRRINLDDIMEGREDNVILMARDVIYVPMSTIGKVDIFVDQFLTNLTPAWLFYIYGKEVVNPEGTYIFGR